MLKTYREIFVSTNFNQKLFILAILVMSIDGFPYIPVNNDNRPLSIIILLVYWIMMKIQEPKFFKFEVTVFVCFIILWVFTLSKAIFTYHDYKGLIKFTLTGFFAYITISSCLLFYNSVIKKKSIEQLIYIMTYSIILSSFVPIGVGLIQFLALKNVIPLTIAEKITNIFSYRPLMDRIQMLNSEASHASNYIIFLFFFIYSFLNDNSIRKRKILIILFFILMLISSAIGYGTFALSIFFYWIFCIKKNIFKLFKYSVLLLIFVVLFYGLREYFLTEYTIEKFQIVSNLISFDAETIVPIISVDFSTYDRIFSPILGFLSLKDTYYLGTGGESFFYNYESFLYEYFPFALNNEALKGHLNNGDVLAIKLLPAKIAGEFGVIPFIGFCYLFIYLFKKLRYLRSETNNTIYDGFSLILIYAFISTWACSYFNFSFIIMMTLIYTVAHHKMDFITKKDIFYAN
jgi:hypothetical protein